MAERKARFVIVARITRPIKRKLAHQRYTSVSHAVEAAEFYYQPTRWLHPYRSVVIRRPQPDVDSGQI